MGAVASLEVDGSPRGVAVSQLTGQVYLAVHGGPTEGIEVFDSDGSLVSGFGSSRGQFEGVAIDQSTGDVYASRSGGIVDAFTSTGVFEGEAIHAPGAGAGQLGSIAYLAVDPTDGHVVVADSSNHRLDEFKVTIADGEVSAAEFIRAIGWGVVSNSDEELQECTALTGCVAGLEGTEVGEFGARGPTRVAIDPSGAIYAVDPSNGRVEQFGPTGGSAATFAEAVLSGASPSDVAVQAGTSHVYVTGTVEGEQRVFEIDPAGAQIGSPAGVGDGLASDEGLALSSFNGNVYLSSESPANALVALNVVTPQSVGATEVATESATLSARFNPGGSKLAYRFEYGQSSSYEDGGVPTTAASVGSGADPVQVSVHLQNLLAGAAYHYRVATISEPFPGRSETSYGSDHVFRTRESTATPALLDGRMWEMVSPADKYDAAFEAAPREGGVIQSSEDGAAITYISYASTESEPEGEPSPEWSQIVSRRGPARWESKDIAPKYGQEWGTRAGHLSAYLAFSEDLSLSLVEPPPGATPPSPGAPEQSPYLRDETLCATKPAECHLPLLSEANVPSGTKFGGELESATDGANFMGSTEDLKHVVLRSAAALTPAAVEQGLYEWNAGGPATEELDLVSVLPESEGGLPVQDAGLGYRSSDVRHAISEDGAHVIWSTANFLYMRDTGREETILLSENQGGSGLGEFKPVFQTANADGSRVFFTDEQRLTADSSAEYEQPDLYVYEVTSAPGEGLAGHVTDLTAVARSGERAVVRGMVLGASEDGTSVYFLAEGILEGVHGSEGRVPMSGAENLYLEQYAGGRWSSPRFIAALSHEDGGQGGWREQQAGELWRLTARVSPDGQWLAFMSDRPLTGYDNHDASNGNRDEEVFLYHASSQALVCASCEPTGARPTGVFDPGLGEGPSLLVDRARAWEGHWLAASLPGWTMHELNGSSVQQPRYLSDSGRLFFDSADALARGDTNATQDVYEYEPGGVGTCKASSRCVSLVSSGISPEESAFLDAGGSGEDVFFMTSGKLVPQSDVDDAYDVYDAHVCSETVPCSTPVSAPAPCATLDGCRTASPPGPQLFGEPVTATFSGAENVPEAPAKPPVHAKSKGKGKSKQAACRARARRIGNRRRRAQALKRCTRRASVKPKQRAARSRAREHVAIGTDR